jgi:putative restriction endonuclease
MQMETEIRAAAFRWIRLQALAFGGTVPWKLLAQGFDFQGERITLVGASGIWKPKQFDLMPISITSTQDSKYEDSFNPEELLVYSYRGTDPNHRDNQGLRETMRTRTPLIYFFGVGAGRYLPVWPVIIIEDHPERLSVLAAIDPAYTLGNTIDQSGDGLIVPDTQSILGVRKYVAAYTMRRLHQASFREAVISAYSESCSLCRLRHRELLDAAHIIGDKEGGGDPVMQNGLCLCKIHHAAFDQDFVGIAPDYMVHVRPDILSESDGPMLMHGLQALHGRGIILPRNLADRPDRERLEARFASFQKTG